MLGMYVHTHWAYNHPYAARTWTLQDWDNYLGGLASLGYDFVLLWPQLDCMPIEPNASDRAYLARIGQAIDLAHGRYGMRFAVVACPNTIGNPKARAYQFEERPYFVCEHKVNPKDRAEVAGFVRGRRNQFEPLQRVDALFVIDSDPGGYIGSTNDEFVDLMRQQIDIFREFNPQVELTYWMLFGWENYNRFWAAAAQSGQIDPGREIGQDPRVFVETLTLMKERIAEPWNVTCGIPMHVKATDQLGLRHKRMHYPYGVIEGEPTFPLTNYHPRAVSEVISRYSTEVYPRGILANSQTHCLQLPLAYVFAHLARGNPLATLDLAQFADDVLPGCGGTIARAWLSIESGDAGAQRALAAAIRAEIGQPHPAGKSSGLLFGDADRFLADLAMNLDVRASLAGLKQAIDANANAAGALRDVLAPLRPYQARLGFVDAYGGPLHTMLNEQVARLGDPAIDAIVQQFTNWREPAVRNGILPRLLDALDHYVEAPA